MKKKPLLIALVAGGVILLAAILFAVVLSRQNLRRHRVFRVAPSEKRAAAPQAIPPVEQWTETFTTLSAEELSDLLEEIEEKQPELYGRYSLAYLHARVMIEENEPEDAAVKLQPFLDAKSPFRELAIYHRAEIEDALDKSAEASRTRQQLIFDHPKSPYRDDAIEEEADHLSARGNAEALAAFVGRVTPSVDTRTRRDLNARLVEARVRSGNSAAAFASGFALLQGGTGDDAADRIGRALDRPEIVRTMTAEQRALLGETFQSHRHYDRAVPLLAAAAGAIPARADELRFALGRTHFGAERYAEAQKVYLGAANLTKDARWKATFFWHAARAVQLQGDNAGAERLMTAAIAVPGKFPATTAALTQRLRTRINQKRIADAASDLALVRKMAPKERALLDASLAYGVGLIGAGNHKGALSALNSIPQALIEPYDAAEIAYWRARALESSDPPAAFAAYLTVLRAAAPSHFAYFARERLDAPAMAPKLAAELRVREAQAANLLGARQFALAKRIETDRILLSSQNRETELKRLAAIYREIPEYKRVMELEPERLPAFPLENTNDRATLLMAMGLHDEAVPEIRARWSLRTISSALTQARALNLGNASRDSIYAAEVLMKSVPQDFVPDLLPKSVRELLYPRYFYSFIESDAKKYGADPMLVLSIMREESRFNPRAKSAAAARGLLQFIISTARDIGRDIGIVEVAPQDLYDPRVIISLGAKYVSELSKEFSGNRYRAAAAYNAGPKQVALWGRMSPGPGDDFFLTAVNFDETKHYVRKVMNSYKRYGEIYGDAGPAGGLRIEP